MSTNFLRRACRLALAPFLTSDGELLVNLVNDLRVSFHQPPLQHHHALYEVATSLADDSRSLLYRPEDPILPRLAAQGYSPLWHARNVTFYLGDAAGLLSLWQAPFFRMELANVLGPYAHAGAAHRGDHWALVVALAESSVLGRSPC